MKTACIKLWTIARFYAFALMVFYGYTMPAQPLTGGTFSLIGVANSGGGVSSGGSFTLTGWVAFAGAGTSLGDEYTLSCGLTGIYVVSTGDVTLKAALANDGQVRLWWSPEIDGYQLEYSPTLGLDAQWEAVSPAPANNNHFEAADQPVRFFRLRKL